MAKRYLCTTCGVERDDDDPCALTGFRDGMDCRWYFTAAERARLEAELPRGRRNPYTGRFRSAEPPEPASDR